MQVPCFSVISIQWNVVYVNADLLYIHFILYLKNDEKNEYFLCKIVEGAFYQIEYVYTLKEDL